MRLENVIIGLIGSLFIIAGIVAAIRTINVNGYYIAIFLIIIGCLLIFALNKMNQERKNRNATVSEIFLKNRINPEIDDPYLAKTKISNIINQLNDDTILVNIKDYIRFNKISANSGIMNNESLWNDPNIIIQNLSEEGYLNLEYLQNKLNNKIESNTIRKEELILIILFKYGEYLEFIKQPENQYDINPSINSKSNSIMNYCPGCGQELLKNTNFCHNCGYKFKKEEMNQSAFESQKISTVPYTSNIFLVLLFIGWFLFFIIGFTLLTLLPYMSIFYMDFYAVIAILSFLIGFLIWIVSIFAVYFDAKNINAGEISGDSPGLWALGVLLLWIIVYPLYLYKRKRIWEENNL